MFAGQSASPKPFGTFFIGCSLLLLAIDAPWAFAASGVLALIGIGLRIEAALGAGLKRSDEQRKP
jgi:hypothetical protein